MSDIANASAVDTNQGQVQDNKMDNTKIDVKNEDLIKSVIEEKVSAIKTLYETKMDDLKKQNVGLDRKVSDYQKQLKTLQTKELTEKEKLDIESKEMQEEWRKIWKAKALAKFGYSIEDENAIEFSDYINGENQDEINDKADRLKKYIEIEIKKGIEKGVNERLLQGYQPKNSGITGESNDISSLTKEQLASKAKEISKMATSKEKTLLLNKIFEEQQKRFTGGK
jgi:hypothetical protein